MRDLSILPAYLINLDSNMDRLASSTQSLVAAGLAFSRVPAVDGRGLDLNSLPDCDPEAALRLYGRPLKGGEYGCYKSHLACAQRMLDEGCAAALVFEDDMILGPGFQDHLIAVLNWLEQSGIDWHMVNLGAPGTRIFTPLTNLGAGHRLVAAHYFPQTAHAILWSRTGAAAFVRDHSCVRMTVDNLFRHVMVRSGKGLAVMPPLVGTTAALSVIDAGRQSSRYDGRRWNFGLLKQKRFWVNRAISAFRKLAFRLSARLPTNLSARPGLPSMQRGPGLDVRERERKHGLDTRHQPGHDRAGPAGFSGE